MSSKVVIDIDYSKYDFKDPVSYAYMLEKGLTRRVVEQISEIKNEPEWMRKFRLRGFEHFLQRPLPTWGADLSRLDFDGIVYYAKPTDKKGRSWEEVPEYIKNTFEKLGIPEAERKFLGGVGAQYESEVVYHSIREDLAKKGVIFVDTDTAVKEYPDLVRKYFGTVVPPEDNKFAALNTATWSGGSFIYVPPGVKVDFPLQAYFRINAANIGQFERTLIIADRGSRVHYIEGCLPGDEKVSTGQQMVSISELKPGDIVVNGLGEESIVRAIRIRDYDGELIEIKPISPHNAFRLTPEHPVLAVRRELVATRKMRKNVWPPEVSGRKLVKAVPDYIPAGELRKGDFIVFPINKEVEDDLRFTEDALRLLGFYLAEGSAFIHSSLGVPVVEFSLGAHEKRLAAEMSELIKRFTGKKPSVVRDAKKNGITLVSHSKELYELCVTGCGRGASSKRLSRTIMRLPPSKQAILLEAYLKGDGSAYKKGRLLTRAATTSEQLAFQLQEILARLGIYSSITFRRGGSDKIRGRPTTREDRYIIAFSPKKRWSEVGRVQDRFLVPIKSVRKLRYSGKVYNIEVMDSSQSYLARGFVVHNCTAPIYSSHSLHAAVVELIALEGAHLRYTTLQNWSTDVYNLVTKRAHAYSNATVEWIDANIGSRATMKYPSVYMRGPGARAEIISVAYAGKGQHQDTGAKAVHLAPHTSSRITAKSVSKNGGRTTYRGLVYVAKGAKGVKSSVRCDALLLDEHSKTDTYPYNEIYENDATVTHEATVGKIGEDQLFYLMSRGLTEAEALSMIVMGFFEPFTRELPMEYAVEFNRLMQLEMSGSVG